MRIKWGDDVKKWGDDVKYFMTGAMFAIWFGGLLICLHAFVNSDVAEAIAGAGIFIGMSNIVRENG